MAKIPCGYSGGGKDVSSAFSAANGATIISAKDYDGVVIVIVQIPKAKQDGSSQTKLVDIIDSKYYGRMGVATTAFYSSVNLGILLFGDNGHSLYFKSTVNYQNANGVSQLTYGI